MMFLAAILVLSLFWSWATHDDLPEMLAFASALALLSWVMSSAAVELFQ